MGRALLVPLLLIAVVAPARASDPIRVAVIDSGIDATHPQFRADQVVAWRDFVGTGATPYDDHGHGTAVASLVAGRTYGSYPDAKLIVAKTLDHQNLLPSWSRLLDAITWSVEQGADIVNVSVWSFGPDPENSLAAGRTLRAVRDQGVLVVWIAGNGAQLTGGVPSPFTASTLVGGSSPSALIVGASDASGRRSWFSQRDPELLAVGQGVTAAWANGQTMIGGAGTSFAAPRVAGYAARLLAAGAPRDPDWLEWVLLHVSRDDPDVPYLDEGYGFLGPTQVAHAEAIARGEQPVPGIDERDAWHLATTGPRVAQSASPPGGVLPPG